MSEPGGATPASTPGWLRACPLFQGLEDPDLEELARIGRTRRFGRLEALFHQDEAAAGFHLIVSGRVKVSRYGADGREQVLHVLEEGAPCGEVAVFQGRAFPATAVALEPVRTLYFQRRDFLDLGARRPGLLLNMMGILAGRLRHFVELVDDLSLKEVSARLARHLLECRDSQGGEVVALGTTKAVLASRLGTIAETLSRTLARLQEAGLIEVEGRQVHLLDPPGLQALAEGHPLP
ncbi:MAG: Crp/Fnr family transcriptional regulator [Gemmatimonadota bacterium]